MEEKKKTNLANKPVPKKTTAKPAVKDAKPAAKSGKPANKPATKPATKTAPKTAPKAGKPATKAAKADAPVKDVDLRGNAVTKKPASKGKYNKPKTEKKPWDKMNQKKEAPAPKKVAAKPVKEMRDFLYLLPRRVSAKSLTEALTFLNPEDVEVWEEECVIEIDAGNDTITFEDIRESLEKEDKAVLNDLRMKQVISCDYEASDAALVRRIMEVFIKSFGGKIASDTEDFTPFLTLEEL